MMHHGGEEVKEHDETVQALRHENSYVYTAPSGCCLNDMRQYQTYNFSSSVYNLGDTWQAIINTGSNMVWGPSSYVRLEYTVTQGGGGEWPNLGRGSIMNLFKTVRLTHRSGEILEQILNVNVAAQVRRLYELSPEDKKKLDGMLGNYTPIAPTAGGGTRAPDGGPNNYIVGAVAPGTTNIALIPLAMLLGSFRRDDQYILNTMIAGAKLELEMENPAVVFANWTAFSGAGGTITSLKPTLVFDVAMPYQALQKQLLEEQADVEDSGLSFTYQTLFQTNLTVASDVSQDIQQAATLCERVFTVVRSAVAATAGDKDSFDFIAPYTNYQYRLGSQYFPLQAIKVPGGGTEDIVTANAREVYTQALVAFGSGVDQYHKSMGEEANLPFFPDKIWPQWMADATPMTMSNLSFARNEDAPGGGGAVYAASLEKAANGMALSGSSSNNSRVLHFDGFGVPAAVVAGGYNVMSFLSYTRVAHLLGDSCVVDR